MELAKKIEFLADFMDIDPSEIKADKTLAELGWDSVAALSFIVMLDEEFNKRVKGGEVRALVTVQDALNMMAPEEKK